MATEALPAPADELARIKPFVEELKQLVRHHDPAAAFSLEPAPDPGIWILNAFVSASLASDPDFLQAITTREVEIQIRHGISISTIPSPSTVGNVEE
jgi:hypothetical protein